MTRSLWRRQRTTRGYGVLAPFALRARLTPLCAPPPFPAQDLLDDDEVSLDDLDISMQTQRPAPPTAAHNAQSVLSLSFADLVQDTQRLGEQQVIIGVLEKLVRAPHLERQRDALGLAQGFDFAKVYQRHTFMRVTTQDFRTVTAANDYDLYNG